MRQYTLNPNLYTCSLPEACERAAVASTESKKLRILSNATRLAFQEVRRDNISYSGSNAHYVLPSQPNILGRWNSEELGY
jgi:hypothetical protein